MTKNLALLIIDPQNDFMDDTNRPGSLAVTGAKQDMLNLASYIDGKMGEIDDIVVTLDTHYAYHIAHKDYWLDSEGNHPAPFTLISSKDIAEGKYKPVDGSKTDWALHYTKELEAQGKYSLIVWPTHCLNNSYGHKVEAQLQYSLENWEKNTGKKVQYVKKGMNPNTENYSIFKGEVPISEDPNTQLNTKLIEHLNSFNQVVIAGEALSHCLASSCTDFVDNVKISDYSKITVLLDCTSSVTGFESSGEKFLDKMREMGINVKKSKPSSSLKLG